MNISDPGFLYIILILPSLFALTLIAEGLQKVLKKESGWVSVALGVFFLVMVVLGYFIFLKN